MKNTPVPKRVNVFGPPVSRELEQRLIAEAGESLLEQVRAGGSGGEVDLRYKKATPYGVSICKMYVKISNS